MEKSAGNAGRAALGLWGCLLVVIVVVCAIAFGNNKGTWHSMLYVVAGGVCCRILWPNQEDAEELLRQHKE